MRIPTLQRYLARQIWAAVTFVLVGFLALFAFFDLIAELRDLGKGEYVLRQIVTVVLLGLPAHAYELMPVAVLIGTLYVLAHLSSNSEYTVMRGAGLSPSRAGWALAKVGVAFVVGTFAIVRPGESPSTTQIARIDTPASTTASPVETAPATEAVMQPVAIVADSKVIRDAQLERYLEAHKQFAGTSALGVPSAFLRSATVDSAAR